MTDNCHPQTWYWIANQEYRTATLRVRAQKKGTIVNQQTDKPQGQKATQAAGRKQGAEGAGIQFPSKRAKIGK